VTAGTAEPLGDAALVRRCRRGDEAAWAELVERFSRYVHAICVQAYRLGAADAEDVFQEVFLRAYEQIGRLRDDEAFRPWIGQMTRRLCIDRLRASGREQASDAVPEEGAHDPALARLDEAMAVRGALATLSPDRQEILDRFFARDESYRTIGDALEIAAGTIASRISRGLGRLRAAYAGPVVADAT
jgi:RNA polymerase sigma factor (sigma-70 family)